MVFFEKRRFPRLNSRIPVRYKRITEYKDALQGTVTKDIGEGGIKVVANEFIPLSAKLRIELFLSPSSNSISAVSKVVWMRKLSYSDQYDGGLQFIDIPEVSRNLIATYIVRNSP